jgi:hypothetical protein
MKIKSERDKVLHLKVITDLFFIQDPGLEIGFQEFIDPDAEKVPECDIGRFLVIPEDQQVTAPLDPMENFMIG